jgi:hypothetical protein
MRSTTTKLPSPWRRLGRCEACPVCHQPGQCLVAGDPVAAVVCRTVTSTDPVGSGWLHELRPGPTWTRWRAALTRLKGARP